MIFRTGHARLAAPKAALLLQPIQVGHHHDFAGALGVTRAREPFKLVPTACEREAARFIEWSAHLNRRIAPIGDLGAGTCSWSWLGIDEREEIYLVSDWLGTFGRMPRAMDGLVLGYMPRELD